VRVADGKPGVECQIDFGRLGMMLDPVSGRRRAVHALIFTAVVSRHMFVWLSFTQALADVVEGCEAAWRFFGGVFRVLIPDNLKPVVISADPVNPTFSVGWLDYAQARGFGTDPARVRSPKDKPRVERAVQYVRGSFFAGETFTGSPTRSVASRPGAQRRRCCGRLSLLARPRTRRRRRSQDRPHAGASHRAAAAAVPGEGRRRTGPLRP
jgi:transposase